MTNRAVQLITRCLLLGRGCHASRVVSLCISIVPWSGIRGKRRAIRWSLTVCYPAIRRHFYYHFLSIATLTDFDLITLSLTFILTDC